MKKVVMTVVGVLALAASGNAQGTSDAYGTWYTSEIDWTTRLTSLGGTATYNSIPLGQFDGPYDELGVLATTTANAKFFGLGDGKLIANNYLPITFSFSGNAFGGLFGIVQTDEETGNIALQSGRTLTFSVGGINTQSLTTSASNHTFLGYISNSTSDITSITVSTDGLSPSFVSVDSFSRASGTNPAGANVAPEPGTLALSLTGGCALVGMVIRRRRMSN